MVPAASHGISGNAAASAPHSPRQPPDGGEAISTESQTRTTGGAENQDTTEAETEASGGAVQKRYRNTNLLQ